MSPDGRGRRRLLVLNASPRRDGASVRLSRLFAELAGADADFVHLYDEGPLPCRACLVCAAGRTCPLPDTETRMNGIMRRLARADVLALASPLHFTSLTAPAVSFISRLQPWWHRPPPAGRTRWGVLLASGGSEYADMFRPARSVAAAAFRVLGLEFLGLAGAAGTDRIPADENPAARAELHSLAERIIS